MEYLKQTTDFQKGVELCAEETKSFLKQHIFDRNKINDLFQKIQERIDFLTEPDYIKQRTFLAGNGFSKQQNTTDNNHDYDSSYFCDTDQSTGVLLDLSMNQNRLADDNYNSTNIRSLCNKSRKREILDKIRKKILDKRRMINISQGIVIAQDDMMWRPWRF